MRTATEPVAPSALPTAARAVGWLAVVAAVGTGLLALGHTGLEIPVVSSFGPAGSDAVWPAAAGFAVATLLYVAIAVGVLRARSWAWPLATAVNALALLSGVMQFRGAASAVGLLVAAASLVLLLTPTVRGALLGSR